MNKKNAVSGKVLTIVNIVVIIVCISATLLLLFPTIYNWSAKDNRTIFGRYLYVNTNNSLEPVMKKNDIIAVQPLSLEQMAVGDFLCYYPVLEEGKGVQFGRIDGIDGDTLLLSDKREHSVDIAVGDISVVGKATDKIFFLGSLVSFLKNTGNRLMFYIVVGAIVLLLLAFTIVLHIKRKPEPIEEKPKTAAPVYSLEDLVEVEDEPIQFEKAPKKEEEMLLK